MNCLACQDLLQRRLDRQPIEGGPDLEQHLTACAACRRLYGAALRLEEGLPRLAAPCPPVDLARRIVAAVLADRQVQQRRRRLFVAAAGVTALAASLLLMVVARSLWPPVPAAPEVVESPPPPTPREAFVEAGEALAALPRITADETVGSIRLLWPVVTPPPMEDPADLPPPFDPTARSLREAGQGLSTGLEPVTNSARRAFGLLLREIPSLEPDSNPGL
jgi:hypothetical protein